MLETKKQGISYTCLAQYQIALLTPPILKKLITELFNSIQKAPKMQSFHLVITFCGFPEILFLL